MARRAGVSILITGIGQKNAERAVRNFLQQNSPHRVFTCGFAGGLDPELKVGDVVFEMPLPLNRSADVPSALDGHMTVPPHPTSNRREVDAQSRLQAGAPVQGLLAELLAAGARAASFHCASRVAITAVEKALLRHTTGKDVVEMESETIHAVCREREIPCATVRVISDAAHEDLPLDFNQLSNPDQSLNFGKLALAIAQSPGKIPALMRLQKNTSFAAKRLARMLSQILVARDAI